MAGSRRPALTDMHFKKEWPLERDGHAFQCLTALARSDLCGLVAISLGFQPGDFEQFRIGALRKSGRGFRKSIEAAEIAIGRSVRCCSFGVASDDRRPPLRIVAGASGKRRRGKCDRNKQPCAPRKALVGTETLHAGGNYRRGSSWLCASSYARRYH